MENLIWIIAGVLLAPIIFFCVLFLFYCILELCYRLRDSYMYHVRKMEKHYYYKTGNNQFEDAFNFLCGPSEIRWEIREDKKPRK